MKIRQVHLSNACDTVGFQQPWEKDSGTTSVIPQETLSEFLPALKGYALACQVSKFIK